MKLRNADIDYDKPDLRVLSLGAGVQSSAVLFMMLEGKIPMADAAIFADTGNEPKEVYKHLDYLKGYMKNKIPLHIVNNSNIVKDAIQMKRNYNKLSFLTMPVYVLNDDNKRSIGRRQCTNQYKIIPINSKIREIMGVKSLISKNIEMVLGISTDEIQRAKAPRRKWQINYYPLLELNMSRKDCIDYAKEKNLRKPPRSACLICPLRSNAEWQDLKNNYPDEFMEAVSFDKEIRDFDSKSSSKNYLHFSMKPLDEINFVKEKNIYEGSLFDDECEGMCGV